MKNVYFLPQKRHYSDFATLDKKETTTKQIISNAIMTGLVVELANSLITMRKNIVTGTTKGV